MADPDLTRERLRIPCADALELMTEHLEGALAPADAARMQAHLAGCQPCSVYLRQLRETTRLVGERLAPEERPVDLRRLDALARMFRTRRAP